jgi:hypothetical protein
MQLKTILCFCLLLACVVGKAQIPSNPLGLNPSRLKWNQIKTDKVQVIFPAGMEAYGQRTANIVHYLWDKNTESVGNKNNRITMILQNQTTIPNGFVTVGPFRSECYMTPPQFNLNGAGDWFDLLVIHEYRHVKQFANSRRGITKLAKNIFGSWTWGGFFGLALPIWYLEGDATMTETALTNAGRGRLPEFDMEYKALALAGKHYSYDKAYAGSFRDYVPSFYNMGYYMTGYARREFGADVWAKVAEDAVRFKGIFYPFGRALKRHTGLPPRKLYGRTFTDLDTTWVNDIKNIEVETERQNLVKFVGDSILVSGVPKKFYTDYRFPQYLNDSTLIAEKSSFEEIRTFYNLKLERRLRWKGLCVAYGDDFTRLLIEAKNMKPATFYAQKLFSPGINVGSNTTLSVNKGVMVWAELTYHERWGGKNYSIIRLKKPEEVNPRKLTSRTRYFAPSLSPDNQEIVVVDVPDSLQYAIVLLDANTGKEIKRFPNPKNYFFSFPVFAKNERKIITVAQQGEENWLAEIDIVSGKMREITARTKWQLSYPCTTEKYIFFSSAYTGTNNIFALERGEGKLFQVTNHALGAFFPAVSPNGKYLAYSGFSAMGYDIYEMEIKPETWQTYTPQVENKLRFFMPIMKQEGGESIISKVGKEQFKVQKFRKASGILNFHSVLPQVYLPEAGLQLLADNKFSTLSATAETFYNINEKTWRHGGQITFAEFYPIFRAGFFQGNRAGSFINFRQDADSVRYKFYNEFWQETDIYAGIQLPFNLTRGTAFNRITLSADYHFLQLNSQNRFENARLRAVPNSSAQRDNPRFFQAPLTSGELHTVDIRLRMSSQAQTAHRQFLPRWGAFSDIRYLSTVGKQYLRGNTFLARLDMYVPALMRTHSLSFNLAYQYEKFTNNYKFRNLFFYPRGYIRGQVADNLGKFGVNYALPLAYPDMKVGSLLFLKRIKANVFFDSAIINLNSITPPFSASSNYMRSVGIDLTFDIRILRLLELEVGMRASYLPDGAFWGEGRNYNVEFLFLGIGI